MHPQVVLFAVISSIYFIFRYLNRTDIPKIKNLPEIPGIPIFGNLLQLGTSHPKVAQAWAKKYGPVFQTRLGNKRVVFANSFDSVRSIWIAQQSALISRPMFHTFHKVVSSSQGLTIGTSPWDDSCKARRKAAGTALNKPAVQSYMPIIDLESTASIKEMYEDSKSGPINPIAYYQRFALNTSLSLAYGFRISGVEDSMLKEITHVEREVSNFRSTSNNWQDYVPLLRILPSSSKAPIEYRKRRDLYMETLLSVLKDKVQRGTDKPCIIGNILKDPDAKLNAAEVKSLCLTMVSAGLDTVPGNLIMGLAYLSSPHGQKIQAKAYSEIMSAYPDNDGWSRCLDEEKVPYITAFCKEVLRFFTVIPICLPRTSIKDITWDGAVIPAGTTFFMNAYAADWDETHFKDPETFMPERYLDQKVEGTPHYAFGGGSRMCSGSALASRELFTAFLRIILAFEIVESKDEKDRPVLHPLDCNAIPTSLTTEPKSFKVGFKVRDAARLKKWIKESEERCAHL